MAQPQWIGSEVTDAVELASKSTPFIPPTADAIVSKIKLEKGIEFPGLKEVVVCYLKEAVMKAKRRKRAVQKRSAKVFKVISKNKFPSKSIKY